MSDARNRLNLAIEKIGIQAKRSLGQNFLVSDRVIDAIIEAVKAFEPTELVEVGPGPGALTDLLIRLQLPLTLIELDSKIASYWRDQGLTVFEEDALRLDWRRIMKDSSKPVLVSNLPYQISASIVIDRSVLDPKLEAMVLMFQKEVAQRIRAIPATENYGMLSVIAQAFWDIALVAEVGPRDFDPAPRVASRVLKFQRKSGDVVSKPESFLKFVKAAFAQRRKLLKSNLGQINIDEKKFIDWLAQNKLKESVRAEELSVKQFIGLYEHLDHSRK